jgi:FKBP-type peptidyl-prolyl cis-trans isomerase
MHNNSALRYQRMLLAGFLASSVLFCSAQTSMTPSATKPAPKKTTTTTGTSKTAAAPKTTAPVTLTTDKDKTSYAIGADLGMKLKQAEIDVDPAILSRAVKDILSGGKTAMTEDEVRAKLTDLTKGLQAKQQENQKKQAEADKVLGDKNRKDGETFLAENKSKEGVVSLPSGLQYKILKTGDGAKPTPQDTVTCNYRGTLLDGKEFDSSYKRGQPASFPVGGVIKGWTEALQLMPVGSKWQLFIPADLAYGDRRAGPDITPGSTLIFEVELLSIKEKTAPAAQQATPPPSGTANPQ